jgi:hypothetical protein
MQAADFGIIDGCLTLITRRKHRAWRRYAAQPVLAERDQFVRGCRREVAGQQHRAAEPPAQALKPADQVHGGANCREIQPVGGADVAPQHLAYVQRRAEWQGRQALRSAAAVEMCHAGARGGDRAKCGIA